MKLARPEALYSVLHRALTGEQLAPPRACAALDQRFSAAPQPQAQRQGGAHSHAHAHAQLTTVLLVDELDYIVTTKQQARAAPAARTPARPRTRTRATRTTLATRATLANAFVRLLLPLSLPACL
jgi:hypothetical protein